MRLSHRLVWGLLFALALLLAVIAFLPLRLALGWLDIARYGIAAREVSGSIWSGRLKETQVGIVPVGDLSARLNLLPLFLGRARVSLEQEGPAQGLTGAFVVTRHSFGAEDLTADLPVGTLFAPLPIAGIQLQDVSVRFQEGQCELAEGRVSARVGGAVAGLALPSGLAGTVRCEAGALVLPMTSQTGLEGLALHIRADGTYRAELSVQPSDPRLAAALAAAGFAAGPRGPTLTVNGRF